MASTDPSQEQPFKATGKEKESVDGLKRRSVPTTTTTVAPQRVPPTSRPISSQSIQSIPSRPSSIRLAPSVSQVVNLAPPVPVVEDDDEQSMDIEEVVHEDPRELMNAIREVETMIEDEYQRYDDHTEYIWPEASPERAERYRRQVQAIRDVFEDEPDMYDTTMVSEYAEEIFQYMSELEVGLLVHYPSPQSLRWEIRLGEPLAQPRLYGWTKRPDLGNAPDAGRLAAPSPPPLSHVARNYLDRHQHH